MPTMEELQAQLAEKIEKLDEERRENAKKNQEERERMLLEVEMERKARLEKYQAQIAAHEKEQKAKAEADEARRQRETADRMAAEQKQAALDDTLRLQREKLEWLEKAIAEAEFAEEQHKKSLENSQNIRTTVEEGAAVGAEYPQTCAHGGASAEGTNGDTPETPLMSSHLKSILRQATRNY